MTVPDVFPCPRLLSPVRQKAKSPGLFSRGGGTQKWRELIPFVMKQLSSLCYLRWFDSCVHQTSQSRASSDSNDIHQSIADCAWN